jgi:hypothetical protein
MEIQENRPPPDDAGPALQEPASGPGAARTILLFHIISARPFKQPLMVCTFLKVYMELGSYFLFLQEQIKDIIILSRGAQGEACTSGMSDRAVLSYANRMFHPTVSYH